MRYGDVGKVTDVSRGTSAHCMVVRPATATDFGWASASPEWLDDIYYVVLLDGQLVDYQKGKVCGVGDMGPVKEQNVTWISVQTA